MWQPFWQTSGKGWAMAFKRALQPAEVPEPDVLTAAMVGIGMNFAASGTADANIEDTLLFASVEAMDRDDLRVLAVLVTWFGVHAGWVNADRLIKLVSAYPSLRVRALWAGLARWQAKDRRFLRLTRLHRGARVDLLRVGTEFQIKRHGEDERFIGGPLCVPANVLRDRAHDVLSPSQLARRHRAYRWRVIIGPSYRADVWAALERNPDLSPTLLARKTYGSFATAWQVRRDFAIARGRGD